MAHPQPVGNTSGEQELEAIMTSEQSRAVARWFSSAQFAKKTIDQQFEIRDRAVRGWDELTDEEQRAALAAAADED